MSPITASLRRGFATLAKRRLYVTMLVVVPVLCTFFFLDLMKEGLPNHVPTAVVDMDRSALSRQVTRNLEAGQLLDIVRTPESYHDALTLTRKGEIFGFFLIPEDFEKDALSGRQPTVTYYSNMTYFVPGTLSFKGFKTTAVLTSAGLTMTKLQAMGLPTQGMGMALLQPAVVEVNGIGNPWMNYSIYLCQSFLPGLIFLLSMLMACWSVCEEMKRGTSAEWLATAHGSMACALIGKLLPQWLVFTLMGVGMQSVMFGWMHFPLHNHLMHMVAAMGLAVMASQAFAVCVAELLPNLRLSLSICSLVGILSFSIAGISFPVTSMYGGIGAFSYILPFRYYFLIYVDQALNGVAIFYSRWYYVALLLFPLAALPGLGRLKKHCLHPVYVS